MNTRIRFEKKFVLFIDILGFSNHVFESVSNPRIFSDIVNALNTINSFGNETRFPRKVTTFSDCFVISYDASTPFIIISTDIMRIQKEFIFNCDMLLRGGVAFDNIVHTDQLLFGPGLVRAYELESKHAINPRFIVDKNISQTWEKAPGLSLTRLMANHTVHRKDHNEEYYYCNYLNGCDKETITHLILKVESKIDELEKKQTKEQIIKKWRWYLEYINSCVDKDIFL